MVAWRLTKSVGFIEIEYLLIELELVCVDDFCYVCSKYVSIFHNIAIKLDLFPACQRVVRTFSDIECSGSTEKGTRVGWVGAQTTVTLIMHQNPRTKYQVINQSRT